MNSFDPVHCVRKALLEPIAFRRDVMFIKHRKERTKVCTAGQARQSTRDCHHLAAVLFIRALVCWIGAGFLGESLYNHFQPGGSTLWFSGQVYSLVTLWWFTAICSMGSFTLGTFAFFRWFLEYLYLTTFGKRKGDWTKASWLPIGCYYIRPRLAACCASAAHATVNRDGVGQHPHSRQRPPPGQDGQHNSAC